jgi:hypothetical protein
MQILNEKPSCGQTARRHRRTQEQVFEAVMKRGCLGNTRNSPTRGRQQHESLSVDSLACSS